MSVVSLPSVDQQENCKQRRLPACKLGEEEDGGSPPVSPKSRKTSASVSESRAELPHKLDDSEASDHEMSPPLSPTAANAEKLKKSKTRKLDTVPETEHLDGIVLPAIAGAVGASHAGSRATSPGASSACSRASSRANLRKLTTVDKHAPPSVAGLELISYLQEGDVDAEELREMLRSKDTRKAVNDRDPCFGWTSLHFMANVGNVQVAKLLVENSANTDMKCNLGNIPLHLACRGNQPQLVELLIAKSAALDCQNNQGWTPIVWAAMSGHAEVLPSLLSSKANTEILDQDGRNAVMWAARHGHAKVMTLLLADAPHLDLRDFNGLSVMDHARDHKALRKVLRPALLANRALLSAARHNFMPEVVSALEAGAFVNARDSEGGSSIGWASTNDSVDMVKYLLQCGADPSLANWRPESATRCSFAEGFEKASSSDAIRTALYIGDRLVYAAKEDDLCALTDALEEGAWANFREPFSKLTALNWAVKNNNAEAIVELHAAHANLEARDTSGWTAVHSAAYEGKVEALSALHYSKAKLSAQTWEGDLPIHIAAKSGDWLMLHALYVAKVNLDAPNSDGFTGLQLAVLTGHSDAISTLLALKADSSVQAKHKRSLFHLAVIHGIFDSAQALVAPLEPPRHRPESRGFTPDKDATRKANGKKAEHQAHARKKDRKKTAKHKDSEISPHVSRQSFHDHGSEAGLGASRQSWRKSGGSMKGAHTMSDLVVKAKTSRESLPSHSAAVIAVHSAMADKDADGQSALLLAILYRQASLATWMISSQADVNCANKEDVTALMLAAAWGENSVVYSLLDAKAKVDARDKEKKQATQYASSPEVSLLLKTRLDSILVQQRVETVARIKPKAKPAPKVETAKPKGLSKSTPALPPAPAPAPAVQHATKRKTKKTVKGDAAKESLHRLRVENLPRRLPADILEDQIRDMLRRSGLNPEHVTIPVDPIKQRPYGYAYLDYKDLKKADMIVRAGGDAVFGGDDKWDMFSKGVRVARELPVTDTMDLY